MSSLPSYTYVPGQTPHPVSDPRGHSFGSQPLPVESFDAEHPELSARWREAVALFEAGYYWEAHEAWESLWHAAGRTGPVADALKSLIKWAAAGVKAREGRPEGVRRHCLRAIALIDTVLGSSGQSPIAGIDFRILRDRLVVIADEPVIQSGSATDVLAFPHWSLT